MYKYKKCVVANNLHKNVRIECRMSFLTYNIVFIIQKNLFLTAAVMDIYDIQANSIYCFMFIVYLCLYEYKIG